MFAKTCLLVLPGSVAKDARNNNIIANRIARWTAGERMSLWREGMKLTKADQPPRKARKRPQSATDDEAEEERAQDRKRGEVISLARRGLPGKAVHQFFQCRGLCGSEWPASRLLQTVGGEWRQASRPTAPWSLQPAGCREGPRRTEGFHWGSERHRSLQEGESGSDDARPVCSGETIRRIIGNALLATEIENLSSHLLPHQLAVGVPAGVEAMAHVTRQWRDDNANNNAKVLINYDEGNAHYEFDRHPFLVRMREVAPGLCKWLEFIYPTDVATHVFYRGRVIPSAAGGQQGCPLIGACHALVKRMVHESLGLVAPLAGSQIQLLRIDPPINLDIAPTFADDGVIAGDESEVLRAIQHKKRVMPMVGLRFSMLQVVAAAAGPQHPGRFRAFQDEGCTPALDGNFEVLKSPIADDTFCKAFCSRVVEKQAKSARIFVRTWRSTGHAFSGQMLHQWPPLKLISAHDTTRVHSDRCLRF